MLGVGNKGGKGEGFSGELGEPKEYRGAWGGFLYGTKGFLGEIWFKASSCFVKLKACERVFGKNNLTNLEISSLRLLIKMLRASLLKVEES